MAAHSAYDMFSWYKNLIVNLVISHLGFWSWNLFQIAPFPDLCLLVHFFNARKMTNVITAKLLHGEHSSRDPNSESRGRLYRVVSLSAPCRQC